MNNINGNDLYQMFNYGTYYIMQERQKLNDINVFPVADGDTGDNLLQTLKTIVMKSKKEESFKESLQSISNSALIGARGNSGVIFAQFVNGLQKDEFLQDQITIQKFSELVETSYQHTVASLSAPVEGTMITIIREWAAILKKLIPTAKNLKDLFTSSLSHINKVLGKTPKMLDVLGENGVVDSGALGFVLFVKGIVSYYNDEELDLLNFEDLSLQDPHDFEGDITFRYCTEGLVQYEKFDHNLLKDSIEQYGDSLVIAQGKERFRIHVHTNEPEKVFEELNKFGRVESQKIDDMQLEMDLKLSKENRVLVTDSIADLDIQFIKDNNIVVIPVNISIDTVPYLDKLSIQNKQLFKNINNYMEYPKTATPSIKYINDLFSKLLLKFDEIIVVTVSSELSGTHEVIKQEAKKLKEKGKSIFVIDSLNNSATEGLLVQKTAEMMNSGLDTKLIINEINQLKIRTKILVCLNTFKYATMSGRVPKAIGKIGMLLGIRPIMSLKEGKGVAYGMSLSQKGITKRIVKLVKKDLEDKGVDSYSIVHCLSEQQANEYKELFTNIIGKEPEYIAEISTATAIHSGVGSVAIGYITIGK